ncbi:MAG: chorismate synthase [Muribaculaceae bacterium]|nr:chorismate synthase [Muribaculaceae bacterium]
MNSFGQILRLTTFGESHGPAIGGVLDGVPSGFDIDEVMIRHELAHRRPGGESMGSRRMEPDNVKLLSGIFSGKTLGTPIGFIIENIDAKSDDYEAVRDVYRPNHADYTYDAKYGIRDYRGGGRASARETACRVCAGAIAMQILDTFGIKIAAYTSQIGSCKFDGNCADMSVVYASDVRCPEPDAAARMRAEIMNARSKGDSVGGVVTCVIDGAPVGLGEPVFDKLQSRLAAAMMSIPAAKGFEYGMGFGAACAYGSQCVDNFDKQHPTNFSGGIQGGISNGQSINMRIAFKPAPTLMMPLQTVDKNGNRVTLNMKGRHDSCVVPRAVPVVRAMAALTILDALLLNTAGLLESIS